MAGYKAKNGFILNDANTGKGWKIQGAQDIVTALSVMPAFETVADGILWDILNQAINERKEYADINDLAKFLTENYI